MDMTALVIAMSIPSAITAFCFWLIERNIQRRDDAAKEERDRARKLAEEKDRQRREYEICQLNMIAASMALSEDYNGVGGLIDADSGDVWELYNELHRRTDVQC